MERQEKVKEWGCKWDEEKGRWEGVAWGRKNQRELLYRNASYNALALEPPRRKGKLDLEN